MDKAKARFGLIIKFLLFILLFFILSQSSINGAIFPFAFAMLFGLAWAGQKVWLLIPAYIVGMIICNNSFSGIIDIVSTVTMLALPFYIHVIIKKPMAKWELFLYSGLSQVAKIVFWAIEGGSPILIILHLVLGLVYLFFLISMFEPLIMRGFTYKLTKFEMVSASIVLITLGGGLAGCDVYGFSFLKLAVALGVLVLTHVSTLSQTLIFAGLMGIGGLLSTQNPMMIAPFIIWALAVVALRKSNRFLSALGIALAEIASAFLFELYYSISVATFLPVLISACVFLCVPQKYYERLAVLLLPSPERLAVKNLLNRNREVLQRRLANLSEVFFDMNHVFRRLIKKEASEEEAKEMIFDELKKSICAGCPEQKHCHRTFSEDTHKIFVQLITIALERGKITLLDFPSYLTSRCGKANRLISEVNTITNQYKSYRQLVGNIDTSKLLISDQLEGVAGIMKALSEEVDTMIDISPEREERLKEELSLNNIICTDAIVYEKDACTTMSTLVVREEDVNKLKLQKVTSKICAQPMAIYNVYPTERAGLVSVNLKTAPRFDCIFGLAQHTKSGGDCSGDRHSIERLDGDKFIFAICDGMGSGQKAGEKAETAIGLIENFYKAGFESDIILSSVNKLLNLERDDIFSSIDICTIDLKNGVADFVKMGASTSYIRGEDGCQIIQCSALPVGVLDNAKAITKKVVLKDKDFIVLCSDGINDAFSSDVEFKDFLLTIKSQNPQEQADAVLEKALGMNNGYAVDDMTVIVVKIF